MHPMCVTHTNNPNHSFFLLLGPVVDGELGGGGGGVLLLETVVFVWVVVYVV